MERSESSEPHSHRTSSSYGSLTGWTRLHVRLLPQSILGWFILCWSVFLVGALVVGALLISLYRQSTIEQLRHAEVAVARGCDAIEGRYRLLIAGAPPGAQHPRADEAELTTSLNGAVWLALRDLAGVEGGIWQIPAGPLAYAFPTYEGTGEKTDLPAAERPRIGEVAEAAAEGTPVARRNDSRSQTLFLYACPLPPGPMPDLVAWTMARVATAGSGAYLQALAGLGVLLAVLVGSAALLGRLLFGWSQRLRQLETALGSAGADLPPLERTGQRDLDRIVDAMNQAGVKLAAARLQAEHLTHQMGEQERLAALGRIVAGVAHEIRNPIAAMRLKAENALAAEGDDGRRERALMAILEQVARLDNLLRNLLSSVQRTMPALASVELEPFLAARIELFGEQAMAAGVTLSTSTEVAHATFDSERVGRALDNLILNALQNTAFGGRIALTAAVAERRLMLAVTDTGRGVPTAIREQLFEPFVTGRPEGTGLGLAIVREVAEAHQGTVGVVHRQDGTTFMMELPWQPC
jgi:signal transduction histidine kinase